MTERQCQERAEFPGVSIHESSYIDPRVSIGRGTKIWHFCHIQSDSVIGENCSFGQNVNVANNVKIGNNVRVQNNVSIYDGVILEDFVFCGPSVVFTNVKTPRATHPRRGKEAYAQTVVKYGATLGANCTIVCGVTIGRFALIAAGAVVTKDVPDHAIMIGVPSRRAGWACKCGGRLGETLICARCRTAYSKSADQLKEIERGK